MNTLTVLTPVNDVSSQNYCNVSQHLVNKQITITITNVEMNQ